MIGTRYPAGIVPLQARPPDEDILNGIIEHMPHVQYTRDVGWWDNNSKGLALVGLRMKIVVLHPVLIPGTFFFLWIIAGG